MIWLNLCTNNFKKLYEVYTTHTQCVQWTVLTFYILYNCTKFALHINFTKSKLHQTNHKFKDWQRTLESSKKDSQFQEAALSPDVKAEVVCGGTFTLHLTWKVIKVLFEIKVRKMYFLRHGKLWQHPLLESNF